MKTTTWVIAVVLAGAMAIYAEESVFWRVSSASTVVVTTLDINGTLAWSNSAAGNNEQVQRATTFSSTPDWQDYIQVPGTGATASVRVFDLNPPAGMVLIPEGCFVMGATTNMGDESGLDELPQHTVYVSAFYMTRYEVTKALWDEVATWAATHGYDISAGSASGKDASHPANTVDWHEAVKWCNARSQRDGLILCYSTMPGFIEYKTGYHTDVYCSWTANGYRLPTEAEWEKAARGGVANARFPWTDYTNNTSHSKANYCSTNTYGYDVSPTRGFHPAYTNGGTPYSSPVGSFAPNGYGLYDMAGNVWEWCWDPYNHYSSSSVTNPSGIPESVMNRVLRGGSWSNEAYGLRCANRSLVGAGYANDVIGFRCARKP